MKLPLSISLLLISACPVKQAGAQPVFTNSFGDIMSENGAGVAVTGSGFKVGTGVFDPATGHDVEVWTFAVDGDSIGHLPISTSGVAFIHAAKAGTSGTFFIAGSTIHPDSSTHEGLLIKLDLSNNVLFTSASGAPFDQQYLDVAPLADGGAIVCGIDDAAGGHDALVARIDPTGAAVWTTVIPGPLDEEANAVVVSAAGDVMITGRQMNFGGTSDCFFARLDLSGNVIWTTSWGGIGNDAGGAIVESNAGKFVMAGTTESYGTFDETSNRIPPHVYLMKIDLAGDTMWTAALGDTLFERRAFTIDVASNGDLLVAGERELSNAVDALVMRTDASGHLLWEKNYDVDGWDRLVDIGALTDGFIACGWSFGPLGRQVMLVRRDESGD